MSDKNLTNVNIGIFLKIEDREGGSSCIRVNTVASFRNCGTSFIDCPVAMNPIRYYIWLVAL
jgi:hypothetical protein